MQARGGYCIDNGDNMIIGCESKSKQSSESCNDCLLEGDTMRCVDFRRKAKYTLVTGLKGGHRPQSIHIGR